MRLRVVLYATAFLMWPLLVRPQTPTNASSSAPSSLPDTSNYPIAELMPTPPSGVLARLESKEQEKRGPIYTLTGDVRIDYNWDCCGLSIEYRRLALGSVRRKDNECCSVTFTLAGVASAGSQYFKRTERIF
jgi:hypothetical protein